MSDVDELPRRLRGMAAAANLNPIQAQWCRDAAQSLEQQSAEIERLNRAIKLQANAFKSGMDAATEISSHQLQRAARLRSESRPEALESERAMNAQLTEDCDRLSALNAKLLAAISKCTGELGCEAYKFAELSCVCGDTSLPGTHRTDGPCYVDAAIAEAENL